MRQEIKEQIYRINALKTANKNYAFTQLKLLYTSIEDLKEKECVHTFPLCFDVYKDVFANVSFYETTLKALETCMHLCTQNQLQQMHYYLDRAILHLQYID